MKIICIEEHTMDLDMAKAVQPALQKEAPYMGLQSSKNAASRPRDVSRPTLVTMEKAVTLGIDLRKDRIKEMDEYGIQMQIVSCSTPAQLAPIKQAVALTQASNDRLAKAVAENPERLRGFAVLPWQDPHAAVDELSRSVNELGLNGALIVGRPGNTFLDDPKYLPVLAKLQELKVPLYIHPFHPLPQVQKAYYDGFLPEVTTQFSLGGWGWHHEAGIQVLRLMLSGTFEKLPDLQVISGHWGEMVPFFLQRLDDVIPPKVSGLSRTISETYRNNVWVTPSGMFDPQHFEFIYKVIGADRIIWSVDYPYLTMDGTREFLQNLTINDIDKQKIAHGNAEKLFRL